MTAPDTPPVDVERLARLLEAATPGPWEAERVAGGDLLGVAVVSPAEPTESGSIVGVTDIVMPADAHLIAALRNAAPALLDIAREHAAVVAERDALVAGVRAMRDDYHSSVWRNRSVQTQHVETLIHLAKRGQA
jgi:hypothetical protein